LDHQTEQLLLDFPPRFYHTYGMTETASHVALREVGQVLYQGIGDAKFKVDEVGALVIRGTVTGHLPLETSDLVHLHDDRSFQWLGRKDFVINTGAYKVQPEPIERSLAAQLAGKFIVSSVPDSALGQKVVLISEGEPVELDVQMLHPYERPKAAYFHQKIALTENGKIDRHKTHQQFLKSLKLDS